MNHHRRRSSLASGHIPHALRKRLENLSPAGSLDQPIRRTRPHRQAICNVIGVDHGGRKCFYHESPAPARPSTKVTKEIVHQGHQGARRNSKEKTSCSFVSLVDKKFVPFVEIKSTASVSSYQNSA